MIISIQIVICAAVIGALTQLIKLTAEQLTKDFDLPKVVLIIFGVYVQRLIPYGISLALWLAMPDVFGDIAESLGLPVVWDFLIALFCGLVSTFAYDTIKDWIKFNVSK